MWDFVLSTFLTLLVVMDPIGLAPVFIGLAKDRPRAEKNRIALKATLVAGGIVLMFLLVGQQLITRLGISLEAFRVAGGALLFLIALDMVFARESTAKENEDEKKEAEHRQDISVFPLAIPLIAGPGTLASVMILSSEHRGFPIDLLAMGGVIAFVLLLCYLALRMADGIARLIGRTGVNVVTRVLGVLLGALAVQYIADGAVALVRSGL